MRASTGISAARTSYDIESFKQDCLKSSLRESDSQLIAKLVEESPETMQVLEKELSLPMPRLWHLGGHSTARTWDQPDDNAVGSVGQYLYEGVEKAVLIDSDIEFQFNCLLRGVVLDLQGVSGVIVETSGRGVEKIAADAVVIATGGFAASQAAVQRWAPDSDAAKIPFTTTNAAAANGDAVQVVADTTGALLVDMELVQLFPTGFINPSDPEASFSVLCPEEWRGLGAVLLDQSGLRFCDELADRKIVATAIKKLKNSEAWLVLPPAAASRVQTKSLDYYENAGLLSRVPCSALAQAIKVPVEILDKEFRAYNEHHYEAPATHSACPRTGKTIFPAPLSPDKVMAGGAASEPHACYWICRVRPAVHYCMGGLAIDARARVLSAENREPIPGLYACGECSGGIHGANRLGGNSLLDCVVFGREAGMEAAEFAARKAGV